MSTEGRIALCPGTYDPVTYGHLDVVERASRLFTTVVVAVAEGSNKKQPLFNADERRTLVRTSVEHLGNVEVTGFNGLVTAHAREVGAVAIVKGVRTAADFDYEAQMAGMNRKLAPDVDTLMLIPQPDLQCISSTLVREIAKLGGDVSSMVSSGVQQALSAQLAQA